MAGLRLRAVRKEVHLVFGFGDGALRASDVRNVARVSWEKGFDKGT